MNRRNSIKLIGGSVAGIAGLVLVDWKWQIIDRLSHQGFFSFDEERMITAIADTIIPVGHPPILPTPNAKPIGAVSTGTDQFLIKFFEKCFEKEDQDLIKTQINSLLQAGFLDFPKKEKEAALLALNSSEDADQKKFYNLVRSNTIMGFTTVKEVMVEYRGYQIAPGFYRGCADVPADRV